MSGPHPGSERIYHVALRQEWDEAVDRRDAYRRSTRGKSLSEEGFIHCSFAAQVAAIANLLYPGRDDVVLLEIDTSRLQCPVRIENIDGGQDVYPHIYGPLPAAAVISVKSIPRRDDGSLDVAGLITS